MLNVWPGREDVLPGVGGESGCVSSFDIEDIRRNSGKETSYASYLQRDNLYERLISVPK